MTTYLVHGFNRQDRSIRVSMLIDSDGRGYPLVSAHNIAEQIAGPGFCFHMSENVDPRVAIPEDAKSILFMSDADLYARVPELDWRRQRRRRSRK
jgi:hypothetical protein